MNNYSCFVTNAYPTIGNVERFYTKELQFAVRLKGIRCSSCSRQRVVQNKAVHGQWRRTGRLAFYLSFIMAQQSEHSGVEYNNYFGEHNDISQRTGVGSNPTHHDDGIHLVNGAMNGEHNFMMYGTPKKIIICGGDGFCGWPTSLFLSEVGHEVLIVDNLSRRNIDNELEAGSLTPIYPITERIETWKQVSGRELRFERLDIANEYDRLLQLLLKEKPDAIIHFAEQRAAPYSMKGSSQKRYTVHNNVNATHNLLCAIVESNLDIHLVHLGTMGVYGYGTSGEEIPEGYIDVVLPGGQVSNILHPSYPGSVYHTTKCLDALLFQFYQKNDAIRITDLHQGIVWGTNTSQTRRDERLINRFDYDSDYGTVLNRFLMQAALGAPLTVYGTGGQTRAFIHIQDTAKCIALAVANPPNQGERVAIFNQVAECHRVRDLAKLVSRMTQVDIVYVSNPRQESAENELQVSNRKFRSLGYEPILLSEGLLDEVVNVAQRYAYRCDPKKILPASYWNKKRREDCERYAQQKLNGNTYARLLSKVAHFHEVNAGKEEVNKKSSNVSVNNNDKIDSLDEENMLYVLSRGNPETMKLLKKTLEECTTANGNLT
ncbi:UDP-sulfoquinovose synthase [Galdieria sulphuraria]|uniref:UDP-sulfoquinovose synthase n=1 Tax=Galdieria sulphuraria TaxID=130081 RepID=M2WYI2_GALSU|nr:UDP-sulfoquinovose synthase [Galdieria sulphuraria]EME29120.1 UDP-sulfoquinovose synthase [Galdieria sulphuraria]|eukprot:XP_005705640.1 UDP-sulfoquinovose synthase [Galdieria sulphuraria]